MLCITDGASNMKKTVSTLKEKHGFEKMLFVTCLDHALHNISKKIMGCYDDVQNLVFGVKKLLVKSSKRCEIFKAGQRKLPSFPVITRYGSCLKSVSWYAEGDNFNHTIESTKKIRETAKGKHNISLRSKCDTVLDLMTPDMKAKVELIHNKYSFIVKSIVKLEDRHISLNESIKVFEEVTKVLNTSENVPNDIKEKMNNLRAKNTGYLDLVAYVQNNTKSKELEQWDEHVLRSLKNAVLTSTEIERVFSTYNTMFRPNRRKFCFENFVQHVISKWYLQIVSIERKIETIPEKFLNNFFCRSNQTKKN